MYYYPLPPQPLEKVPKACLECKVQNHNRFEFGGEKGAATYLGLQSKRERREGGEAWHIEGEVTKENNYSFPLLRNKNNNTPEKYPIFTLAWGANLNMIEPMEGMSYQLGNQLI